MCVLIKHRQHARGLVQLDEAHPAHVGSKIEDVARAGGRAFAGAELGQIERQVVDVLKALIPLAGRLDVDRSDSLMTAAAQFGDEMATDEPSGSGDDNEVLFFHQISVETISTCPVRLKPDTTPGHYDTGVRVAAP